MRRRNQVRTTQRSLAQWALLVGTFAMLTGAQESNVPELTLDEAIAQAAANNSNLKTADLEIHRAAADLAANRTRRFANTQIVALGGQLLTKPSVTFPQGSLGVYSATGPIPATDQTIHVARKPVGVVFGSVMQPLSTQYRLHLQLKALSLGVDATRQDREKARFEVIDQVRRAYNEVAEAQSAFDSLQSSLPYYEESKRLALENRRQEAILESDLLGADAQLLKTQNAIRDAGDRVASAAEKLNDLIGRDIHTRFRVSAINHANSEIEPPATLEARALENRPELKKAKLKSQQADYDARAKKAEYIPDVSVGVTYFTAANFSNALPSNIATAGLQLTWEPWDWGRRRQEYAAKRVNEQQAKVAITATERSVLLEVRNAWRQLETAQRQLSLSAAVELVARQKLKEVQEQVKREAVLSKDLFQAQSELASADSQQSQTLAEFWKASADLKKAIGEQ
jgi:outer membrane protein TolC